jgi:hypothetical protein
MAQSHPHRTPHPLVNPLAVAERLAIWSMQARRAGREERADLLLLSAWIAYDQPCAILQDNHPAADIFMPLTCRFGIATGGTGQWCWQGQGVRIAADTALLPYQQSC